jgi:hypothetical protein
MCQMSLLRVGGWMKYKKYYISKKKRGFTIIESLAYIFLTTMVLVQGLNLYVLMYKNYIDITKLIIKYNNYQNFYINLDNVISEGNLEEIKIDDNYILLSKNAEDPNRSKTIKSYEGEIVVKCIDKLGKNTINTMIKDIDNIEVKKKGKLIYLIIHDKDGKEFIKCI